MDGPNQGSDLPATDPQFGKLLSDPAARGDAPASQGYVVVARRYRPQSFGDLVGQNSISRALSNAILSNRVGHAYLFTGARGVGKTSSARILAKCLNCVKGPTPTPCNECDICRAVSVGEDVDVLEIDGASNRGIDEIRELRQNVNVRPSRARYKIYIIDEVHMLTTPAFNALLKTLEEPPEHVKFIFCTTEAEKIPITILSRCQRFDFAGISVTEIAERLRQIAENEGVDAEPEALELLARRAAGSMRDSQSLLEQLLSFGGKKITASAVHAMLGTAGDKRLGQILELLVARQPGAALAELDEALGEGVDVGQIIGQLLGIFRDCLVAAVGAPATSFLHVGPSGQKLVEGVGQQLGVNTILAAMQVLDHTLARMRYSTHGRTLAELALVRIAGLEDLEQISELLSQIESGSDEALPAPTRRLATPPADASKKKSDAELVPSVAALSQVVAAPEIPQPPAVRDETPTQITAIGTPFAPTPATAVERSNSIPPVERVVETTPRNGATALDIESKNLELAAANSDDDNEPFENGAQREFAEATAGGKPQPVADLSDAWGIWRAALERVIGLTGDHGRKSEKAWIAEDTAISGPKQLVVAFPTKYTSSKSFCELSDRQSQLVQALSATTGWDWTIRFEVLPPDEASVEREAVRPAPRRDLITEKSQHPLVQKTVELFKARVAKVEEPAG